MESLGIRFTELGDDYLDATMPVDRRTFQPYGLLHGGASVALAESLGSFASVLCLAPEDDRRPVGIEINANHVRSATEGTVTGRCRPLHLGGTIQVWEIRVSDPKDKLLCVSRLTVSIVPSASASFYSSRTIPSASFQFLLSCSPTRVSSQKELLMKFIVLSVAMLFSTLAPAIDDNSDLEFRRPTITCEGGEVSRARNSVTVEIYGQSKSDIVTGMGFGVALVHEQRLGVTHTTRIPVHGRTTKRFIMNIFAIVEESGSDFLLQGNPVTDHADEEEFQGTFRLDGRLYKMTCRP